MVVEGRGVGGRTGGGGGARAYESNKRREGVRAEIEEGGEDTALRWYGAVHELLRWLLGRLQKWA